MRLQTEPSSGQEQVASWGNTSFSSRTLLHGVIHSFTYLFIYSFIKSCRSYSHNMDFSTGFRNVSELFFYWLLSRQKFWDSDFECCSVLGVTQCNMANRPKCRRFGRKFGSVFSVGKYALTGPYSAIYEKKANVCFNITFSQGSRMLISEYEYLLLSLFLYCTI
jgi:hypothetical protein